jgi:hypothetical protein
MLCKLSMAQTTGSKGNVVPVLHNAPRHAYVWGCGGIAPHIPNLSTKGEW